VSEPSTVPASAAARWPYAVYAVLSAFFCAPLFTSPDGLGISDWDQHLFYYGSVLKNLVEYGQLPFWNPWYCGGNVLWQNPQIPLLSPAFPLSAIFSLALAMKINILLHYFVGFVGMHLLLAGALGLSFMPAVIYLSTVATLGGAMALHLAVGHSVFLPCFYLPLQLYFCLRAFTTGAMRHVASAAMLLALMIYNGALHVVPMSLAGLGLLGLFAAAISGRWRPLIVAGTVAVMGFAYAAPKLLPVALWVNGPSFTDVRTTIEHPDRSSVEMLQHVYLDRFQHLGLRFDQQRSRWHEYGNYIGALAAFLIAASSLWALLMRRSRDWSIGAALAATSVVLLVWSAGEFSAWAPASIASHIPLFSSFRIPSRYTIAFVLFGVATSGWVIHQLEADGVMPGRARVFLALLCGIATADLVLQNRTQFERVFSLPAVTHEFAMGKGPVALQVDATSDAYTNDSPMFRALLGSRAFYNCYESLQTRRVATPAGPLVESDGKSTVSDIRFSPNRIEFAVVTGREPSRVVLNQNFTPGWRSSASAVAADPDSGKPSVVLAAGQAGRFAFGFRPPGLVTGFVLMLVAAVVTAMTWRLSLPR
jgi:hypothetical protein